MEHIDAKFKEVRPEQTVARIRDILSNLGLEIEERWNNSGLDNCWSLHLRTTDDAVYSNGKGVTKEFAQASAYGEFIERLQSGLFLYKYQSVNRDPEINLHTYAPDAKYMTEAEIIENGEWMDHIIDTYGSGLTREKLAQQCRMYACTDGKLLTLPYYSLFENKYVYLPAGFVEQMYSANGCCVGNTREEAWVHALSEIMERKGSVSILTSGKSAKIVPESVLQKFPTVMSILNQIRASGKYDVTVFDTSIGNGHPIITTRIINKEDHTYVVNTGSDPIFEIAIHRTLTEIFQGRNIKTFTSKHNGQILTNVNDIPLAHNVLNLLETGNGLFSIDFFAEELGNTEEFKEFTDHSGKTNAELVQIMLDLYRGLNKPVYVRNYSYLGFHCYKFIVPGFSESRGLRLTEPFQEYLTADAASKALRDPIGASVFDLNLLLAFHNSIQTIISRRSKFTFLSGIMVYYPGLLELSLACAAYRLGLTAQTIGYLKQYCALNGPELDDTAYFSCFCRYLELKRTGRSEETVRLVLRKFYEDKHVDQLFDRLDQGISPFQDYVLQCDTKRCSECNMAPYCRYQGVKRVIRAAGGVYHNFTEGQAPDNFKI